MASASSSRGHSALDVSNALPSVLEAVGGKCGRPERAGQGIEQLSLGSLARERS